MTDQPQPPVQVPADVLSEEALAALVEEFILREGTDYGREEIDHQTKRRQIHKQLQSGSVVIVFDPETESVTLMTAQDWGKARRGGS